jgi:hypothetical protein
MRHNLYFHTVDDAQKVLEVIKQGFTSNVVVIEGKTALSFTTPYRIREASQARILQGVSRCKSNFNLEEKNG